MLEKRPSLGGGSTVVYLKIATILQMWDYFTILLEFLDSCSNCLRKQILRRLNRTYVTKIWSLTLQVYPIRWISFLCIKWPSSTEMLEKVKRNLAAKGACRKIVTCDVLLSKKIFLRYLILFCNYLISTIQNIKIFQIYWLKLFYWCKIIYVKLIE